MKRILMMLLGILVINGSAQAQDDRASRAHQHPVLVGAVQAGLDVFWWDPLAALAATDVRLVDYRFMRISVVQDGVSSGRTIESPTGTGMRVGVSANQALFESEMLEVLNGDEHP